MSPPQSLLAAPRGATPAAAFNRTRSVPAFLSLPWRFAAIGILAVVGRAAPLTEPTAVQTRPDSLAPAITVLKAGTEPAPAAGDASAPAGWMAVSVPGPFEGYVRNSDLAKSLDVKPGSSIYLAPDEASGVLAVAAKSQKTVITGLRGKWTQIRLDGPLVGYIRLGPAPVAGQSAAAPQTAPLPQPVPAPSAEASTEAGKPAAAGSEEISAALPRFLEGKFVSSRRLLAPRRPFDWQIDDPSGSRIAYLDVSRLLLTEQIDSYVGHTVEVFGAARPVAGTRDIVILVENLHLK